MTKPKRAERPQRDVEVVPYETAIAAAGQAYAEGMAEQLARSPHEAAIAAIGRSATPEQIDAWITRFRPHAQTQDKLPQDGGGG